MLFDDGGKASTDLADRGKLRTFKGSALGYNINDANNIACINMGDWI